MRGLSRMFSAGRWLLVCLWSLGWLTPAVAQMPVEVAQPLYSMSLTPQMELLFDEDRNLAVLSAEQRNHMPWQANRQHPLNLQYRDQALWLRVPLVFPPTPGDYRLELASPLLDRVEAYWIPQDVSLRPHFLGTQGDHVRSDGPEQHRFMVFDLPAAPGAGELLVRIQTRSALMFSVTLWDATAYQQQELENIAWLGAMFGILLVMALYNLGVWLFVRDRAYLFYVGYCLSAVVYLASLTGFGRRFLWGDLPWLLNDHLFWFSALLCFIFAAFFVAQFLDLRRNNPMARRLVWVVVGANLGLMLAYLVFPESQVATAGHLLGLLSSVLAWGVGVLEWRRGTPGARYFSLAWTLLLLGTCIYILMLSGWLPENAFTSSVQMVGMTLETGLLSLALGERINQLRLRANQASDTALRLAQEVNQAHEERIRLQHDINQRLEAEVRARTQALEQAKLRAENADRQKTRFLAAASHDIRQPLQALSLLTETLPDRDTPALPGLARTSANLRRAVERLIQLFDALFDLSKLDSQRVQPHYQTLDLNFLLVDLEERLRPLCLRAGMQLEVLYAPRPLRVLSDALLLERVLMLLADNAIQHSGGSRLRLRLENDISGCRLLVEDNGIGIPEAEREHVFDEFYQIGHPLPHRRKGMGLGLAQCRRLVSLLGLQLDLAAASSSLRLLQEQSERPGCAFVLCFPQPLNDIPATSVLAETIVDCPRVS